MNYKIQHITNSNKVNKGKMTAETLTIHSTANLKSTAQNERDWLNNSANRTSTGFHLAVDDKQAIECMPLDQKAHHSGNTKGNNTSIGLEICESGDRRKTLENAVKLSAKILKERNWGIDKLKRHYDWSGKNCPRILSLNNWQGWTKFKEDVEKELGGNKMAAMRKGDKGSNVKKLQEDLIRLGYKFEGYGADGSYGGATERTVEQFQKDFNLKVDKIAGPEVQAKIKELLAKSKPVSPSTNAGYITKTELKKIFQDIVNKL